MNKEGFGILLGLVLSTIILALGGLLTGQFFLKVLAIFGVVLIGFVVYFFRDPVRKIPDNANYVLSPADGKVIAIQDEFEHEYLQSQATRVSIFLNLFDVHVNRMPIGGRVAYFRYQKGSFIRAYKDDASDINEQTVLGIENERNKLLFKQIAGLIARRIVCDIREGNVVRAGERFGMIKFGSRVDIFLPKNVEIKVNLNQKVKGGESILGVLADEK